MSDDALHDRGKALEDLFFQERDKQLLNKLKAGAEQDKTRDALRGASGINDDQVLDELIANGIRAETIASVALIPLVAVAWADGIMERPEQEAILKAAEQSGIQSDDPSLELIDGWLKNRPPHELLDSWKDYVKALAKTMEASAYEQLRHVILRRAKDVAESAGGFLGLGRRTSHVEQRVLDELEEAFQN